MWGKGSLGFNALSNFIVANGGLMNCTRTPEFLTAAREYDIHNPLFTTILEREEVQVGGSYPDHRH
jgi:hypothetical protein